MTNEEFDDQFMPDFRAHFPEVGVWLSRQVGGDGQQDGGRAVLLTWAETLQDVRLDDAMDATARIHRGDIDRPDGWSGYPGLIRKVAKADRADATSGYQQPRYRAGEPTYTCPLCRDQWPAVVLVLSPLNTRQAVHGLKWDELTSASGKPGVRACTVACSCRQGSRLVEVQPKMKWHQYDPMRMFLVDNPTRRIEPEGFAEWQERAQTMRVKSKPTYSPELAAFNEQPFE